MIGERRIERFRVLTLESSALGGIDAAVAVEAGMVICSLRHRGEELLGQRGGLRRYVDERSTMGIPLLYPWANRLGSARFDIGGREVDVEAGSPQPALDPAGLPIHGLLSGARDWRLERRQGTGGGGLIAARFDFTADQGLMAAFPFPHELSITVTLGEATLTITTAIEATGQTVVPIAFGFHPYLRLPGVARPDWEVQIPVSQRLELDQRMLPTGEVRPVEIAGGPLGSRTFDDAFVAPVEGKPFVLAGGGRRIEMRFDSSYPFAQVYAPGDDAVIAFEPMTAPSNAMITGGRDLRLLEPGGRFEAGFSVRVCDPLVPAPQPAIA